MRVFPVYLFIDTSASMRDSKRYAEEQLIGLIDGLRSNPVVGDVVHFALIEFNDTASETVPLTSIANLGSIRPLRIGGGTNYGNAFRLAKKLMSRDVEMLRGRGDSVFRPLMVFLSDGTPMDHGWPDALDELQSTDFRAHPAIIAIGFGSSDPATLLRIGTTGAFVISDRSSRKQTFTDIFSGLISMIGSTASSSIQAGEGASISIPPSWLNLGDALR